MTTFLLVLGWVTAAHLALDNYHCRKLKRGIQRRWLETNLALRELECKHLIAKSDRDRLEWYINETTRLREKCDAICSQIRRMKGRGKGVCEIYPQRHF